MPTLRDRKKAATRAAISAAALPLFAERGFRAVTMSDVAAAANVGERTVFRHFGDKQELLFGEEEPFRAALGAALAGRPPTEPPMEATAAASAEVTAALHGRREELAQRLRIIRSVPALVARERAKHAGFEAVVVDTLVQRGVARPRARLVARIAVACYDEAVDRWLEHDDPDHPGLPGHIAATFADLGNALAPSDPPSSLR